MPRFTPLPSKHSWCTLLRIDANAIRARTRINSEISPFGFYGQSRINALNFEKKNENEYCGRPTNTDIRDNNVWTCFGVEKIIQTQRARPVVDTLHVSIYCCRWSCTGGGSPDDNGIVFVHDSLIFNLVNKISLDL